MKIKFTGVPSERHDSLTMYGYFFPLGEEVNVTDAFAIRKLKNHPHFEAVDDVTEVAFKEETGAAQWSRADLEALAEAAGIKVDRRWSDARLTAEIEKVK